MVTLVCTSSAISLDTGKFKQPDGSIVEGHERILYGDEVNVPSLNDKRVSEFVRRGALVEKAKFTGRRQTARDIYNLGNTNPTDPAAALAEDALPVPAPQPIVAPVDEPARKRRAKAKSDIPLVGDVADNDVTE